MEFGLWLSGLVGVAVPLAGIVEAQSGRGYRLTDTRVVTESQVHWEHWARPQHVIDIEGGQIRPHFFRRVYNLLAGDQATFRRSIELPKIRGEARAILTVGRQPKYARDGALQLEEKRIGKYLDIDFLRYPGYDTQLVQGDELFAILDTSMSGDRKEVTLSLRNELTGERSTQTLGIRDKEKFPKYEYFIRPGISRAGSNPASAVNILDGDVSTYWEPDLADTSDNWWVEIDLGRVVAVEKVVLHFVDANIGDPFRQFRVLASPQQRPLEAQDQELGFSLIGGTKAPNTVQRTFEFTMGGEPRLEQKGKDPNWTGRLIETLRILVSDSKRYRGHQIDLAGWEALPSDERGDVVYFIRDESGFEEPVSQGIYQSLGPERQGRREYYLRERPRLTEVEIWGWGDNLSPFILGRGGTVDLTGPYKATAGFDGDWGTNFRFLVWSPVQKRGVLTIDLGALIWLDVMRLAPTGDIIDGYIVRGSDGALDARGELKWRAISSREREDNLIDRYTYISDIYDPPVKVRYLHMRNISTNPDRRGGYNTGVNLGEIMMYSEGYAAEATVTSDIIRLPGARNLGAIHWHPGPDELPHGTEVEIRTRSGDLLVEQIRYLDTSGNEKTKKEWEGLFSTYRGPIDTSVVVGSGWSAWSRKYLQPGDHVTSPGLRQFLQIQAKFITRERQQSGVLSSIEVEMFDPVARTLIGEIWPQQAIPGLRDTFDIYLHSTFTEAPIAFETPGFDEIRLQGPAELDLRLVGVQTGTEAEFLQQQPHNVFEPVGQGFLSGVGDTLQLLRNGGGAVEFRLPAPILSVSADLVAKRYHRITSENDQVVVGHDGELLSEAAYGLLSGAERGKMLFFRQITEGAGQVRLQVVADRFAYDELATGEQGPIRYFRKLLGSGAEFPFTVQGDTLNEEIYKRLVRSERGTIQGEGRLLQLRVAATVFLNGTTMQVLVRKSDQFSPAGEPLWQQADAGNATALSAGQGLSLSVPVGRKVLGDLVLTPNPFTPNNDGINDELAVSFSVFRVSADRQVRLRFYRLDGRCLWEGSQIVRAGTHILRWSGVDHVGLKVPPGLYVCQLHIATDANDSVNVIASRIVAVAY